MNMNTDQI